MPASFLPVNAESRTHTWSSHSVERSERLSRHLLLFIVLSAGSAAAQDEGLGLDLTDNPKKEEPKKEEPKKETAPPPAAADNPPAAPAKNNGPAVERDITQEDRVKS